MGKKILQFVLILTLILPFAPRAQASSGDVDIMKIGLFYGSNALAGANLLNAENSGYRFGYFDSGREFVPLGYTYETALSVVKTQNVYYSTQNSWPGYDSSPVTGTAVGCWHVQIPGTWASFEEAQLVASSLSGGFVAWIDGTFHVRQGAYLDKESATSGLTSMGIEGSTVVGTSSYGVSVVVTGTSTILFQFDGGSALSLGISPGLEADVTPITHFRGYKYYGDFQYTRKDGGDLTVVNFVEMEAYVNSVISREMSSSWPLEALKAQAVCARTYAAMNLHRHASDGFDLCYSTHCQAYFGMNSTSERTEQAAAETAGVHVWYEGSMADTFYSAANGGASESVENVWSSNANMPYLLGIPDPYEADVAHIIPSYVDTTVLTKQDIQNKLVANDYDCGEVVDFRITEYTDMGNVYTITVYDANGNTFSFSKESARLFFGFRSQRYVIEGSGISFFVDEGDILPSLTGLHVISEDGSVDVLPAGGMPYVVTAEGVNQMEAPTATGDDFHVTTYGWGHNVGMSQWGAYAMAERGLDYVDILSFYFTGVEVY